MVVNVYFVNFIVSSNSRNSKLHVWNSETQNVFFYQIIKMDKDISKFM